MTEFNDIEGFDWDIHNINKNWLKHSVGINECEEVFFNEKLIVSHDTEHSIGENRYFVLGKTKKERLLFIVFTIRNKKIRIISARDMNKKEKSEYEKNTKIQD